MIVDPEMRAEFEKQSRSSPMSGATRGAIPGAAGGGGPPSFDFAGWMAGTAPGPMSGGGGGGAVEGGAQDATTGTGSGRDAGAVRRR